MKKPVFNFVVEIVPMKPSALMQAADIVQEVTNVARRLRYEQLCSDPKGGSSNKGNSRAASEVKDLGAYGQMAALRAG
jgi:hypothetical protein